MLSVAALFVLAGLPGQITNSPVVQTNVANSWCRTDAECRAWFDYDAKCAPTLGTCQCGGGYSSIGGGATGFPEVQVCTGPDVTNFYTDATVELKFTNAPNTGCRMTADQVAILQRIMESLFTPTAAIGTNDITIPQILIMENCGVEGIPAVDRFHVTIRVLQTQALTAAAAVQADFTTQYDLVANAALKNVLGNLLTYRKMYGEQPCFIEGGAKTGYLNSVCNAFTCKEGYETFSTNPSFPRTANTLCTSVYNSPLENTVQGSDDELTNAGAVVAGVGGALALVLFALFVICKALNPPSMKERLAAMEETKVEE